MRPGRVVVAAIAASSAVVAALAIAMPAYGSAAKDIPRADLARVRAATARFHDVEVADGPGGYDLLDRCFDGPDGGMGIHYLKGVDEHLDALAPEALVYEVTKHGPKLVAVEYIVPLSLSNAPPEVLGQPLHPNEALGLWVLHAWIWKPNPAGMFEDFNPNVARCP
jgi:hypothetical protein